MLICCIPVSPAQAQDAAPDKVQAAIDAAHAKYMPRARTRCGIGPREPGEIVVCAPDKEKFRVAPTSETDPLSDQATNDGVPRAPSFAKLPGCAAPGAICGGYAPPPIYIIDLKAIPEAPEGSDAEKVGNGEMPTP